MKGGTGIGGYRKLIMKGETGKRRIQEVDNKRRVQEVELQKQLRAGGGVFWKGIRGCLYFEEGYRKTVTGNRK